MKLDLHLHSHVSDGELPPARLVEAAVAAGLDLIALTDHDTAAGVPEAQRAAAELPVEVIAGIEISTRTGEHEFHMLGYHIDPLAPSIVAHQDASVHRRTERMRGMVEKLQAMGIPITFEEVVTAAGPDVRSLGRPHLARALHAAGHTRYYGEAFARFIADGGPAFVAQDFPSPEEAIAAVHAAGGVAVWAHPPLDAVADLLPEMVKWGLDGVECYRSNLSDDDVHRLLGLARENGLFPTGGSDWHGPHRAPLGSFFLRPEQVEDFLQIGRAGG
ncbi:MAG TPA: PHP domain-containing protein [Longimicrobiaceae bacterium]|nr:PHP domain-containing protein [Longimicrobiaceae bacterium]